ncbi:MULTISPECIES: YhbY family RNA-binding protein [unclassified Adlercreutzia]|uniref:YhbY family RNA-binding protein n=1 Tax=unclassified Adlercreutzia TaxID=2636013 RepID=UPI0013EA266D|nr:MULTISPECIES: YhbY family RNA-binding protein [unclassified Adlercreutzia]
MAEPLTGKQIRQLRSMANTLKATLIIGKEGVGAGTAKQASEALEAHELIKCSVLDAACADTRDVANDLAARVDANVVQVIGHKFVLYRASSREDVEHIELV